MHYDFNALYGQADMTAGMVIDAGSYDAVVESSEWGNTKSGDKGAWTIKFRITTGQHAGVPLTMTMSVSPTKQDGTVNSAGLGIMYRQLGALGVPVPPNQPFWAMGWSEENVAQAMTGRPCLIRVIQDEYDGRMNNKVRGIEPARPGAPTDWPRNSQQQPQQGQGGQFGPIAQMPGQLAQNGAMLQQPQGPYGQPSAPWNPAAQGQPAYGAQPGQGGTGEFTQQGQSQQPWMPGAGYQHQNLQPQASQGYGTPPGPQPGQPSPWNAGPQAPAQASQGPSPVQGYQQGLGGVPAGQPASYPSYAQQPQNGQLPQDAPGWAQGPTGAHAQQGYAQNYPAPGGQAPAQGPAGYQPQEQQPGQSGQGGPPMPPWAQ